MNYPVRENRVVFFNPCIDKKFAISRCFFIISLKMAVTIAFIKQKELPQWNGHSTNRPHNAVRLQVVMCGCFLD